MPDYYLHSVIVNKDAGLYEAKKIARQMTQKKRIGSFRVEEEGFAFRNLPKNYFKPGTFRKKKIDEKTTVVFGELKFPDKVETNGADSRTTSSALEQDTGSEGAKEGSVKD